MHRRTLVVFTGAGISAESGLDTFRDTEGLWERHRLEDVATPEAWQRDPELVLRFYNERRKAVLAARPNAAHHAIAQLEQDFKVRVITQNIDDLHERAGSSEVLHLHGEILKMRTEKTDQVLFDIREDMLHGARGADGSPLRPHVVWFGEPVPQYEAAARIVSQADILVIIGSSLRVYPAAGLIDFAGQDVPVFMLDKQIPSGTPRRIRALEMPAVQGIGILKQELFRLS